MLPNLADVLFRFERANPDLFYHIAKGRISAGEAPYAAIICRGDTDLGAGESHSSHVEAFLKAVKMAGLRISEPDVRWIGLDLAEGAEFMQPPFIAWGRETYRPVSRVVARIAEVAAGVSFQAGEPALELAGHIVSCLAANPEHSERFMAEGPELFIDRTFAPENGSLSYRARNGSIMTPAELRASLGKQQ